MNKVVLFGRLVRDPEVSYTRAAEPLAFCRFSVAVDRPYTKNKQGDEPTADFVNCVSFGKRAEAIGQYFRRGNKIALVGRIQTGSYTDKDGNKRYTTDVVVDDFEFVEAKSKTSSGIVDNNNTTMADGFFTDEDVEEALPF